MLYIAAGKFARRYTTIGWMFGASVKWSSCTARQDTTKWISRGADGGENQKSALGFRVGYACVRTFIGGSQRRSAQQDEPRLHRIDGLIEFANVEPHAMRIANIDERSKENDSMHAPPTLRTQFYRGWCRLHCSGGKAEGGRKQWA